VWRSVVIVDEACLVPSVGARRSGRRVDKQRLIDRHT
jgi:hypothetical protein